MSEKRKPELFDKKEILDLIELLHGTDVSEIEVENEGRRVRLRRGSHGAPVQEYMAMGPAPAMPVSSGVSGGEASRSREEDKGHVVKAPIVGSFYRSPSPDSPPFVELGSTVNKGQVLCIIEAMKLMNEIEAEISGTLRTAFVQNGESVEYGQPLFVIDPA